MVDSLSQRVIGRLAALLLLLGGALTIASAVVPDAPSVNRGGLLVVGGLALVAGGVAWRAPWQRWPREASLWLVPPALVLVALGDVLGGADPYTFGVFFVVIFAWVGTCHAQWTAAKLAPIATLAYVLPLLREGHSPQAPLSAVVVIPLAVLLGEVLAWVPSQMRKAQEIDAKRMAGMSMLLDAAGELSNQMDPGQAAHVVACEAVRLLAGQGAVVLMAEDRTTLAVAGACDWPLSSESGSIQLDKDREVALALGDGPVFLPPDRFDEIGGASGFGSVLVLPVGGKSQALAAIVVGFRQVKLELDEFAENLARAFAAQVGLAFERLKSTQVLIDASLRDELTGLGNRRFANQMLDELRPGDALVLLDLDELKTINDTDGHAAGDDVLRKIGSFLRSSLREADRAARYGGDEFLLVLTGTGQDADIVVGRLAEEWRATRPRSTFSAGVAVHEPGRLPAQTLIRADSALYRAKEGGRNRVRSFDHDWAPRRAAS